MNCRELTLDISIEKIDECIPAEILYDLHSLSKNTPSDSQLHRCNDVLWNFKKRIVAYITGYVIKEEIPYIQDHAIVLELKIIK